MLASEQTQLLADVDAFCEALRPHEELCYLEHRFNDMFSAFGRAARAFRTPNVDERVSSGPAFDAWLQIPV